jgi:hypothetical protein
LVQRSPQLYRHIVGGNPPEKVFKPGRQGVIGEHRRCRRTSYGSWLIQYDTFNSAGRWLVWWYGGG